MQQEYNPLISVLIASYNHEAYLQETIESIWQQSYSNIEIIVVDDCSHDNSWALLQSMVDKSPVPMRIKRNKKNFGPAATCNIALSMANGELVAFLASDDLFAKDRFSASVKKFAANPQLQVVYANGRVLNDGRLGGTIHREREVNLLKRPQNEIAYHLYTNTNRIFVQCGLFKKSVLIKIGGYDDKLLADDWLLNAKLFSSFDNSRQYTYIPNEVIFYRQHEGNVHKEHDRQERLKIEFIEKYTPDKYKAEGFSNIYFAIAEKRAKHGDFIAAWDFYIRSQKSYFHWPRLRFALLWLRKPLEAWRLLRSKIYLKEE